MRSLYPLNQNATGTAERSTSDTNTPLMGSVCPDAFLVAEATFGPATELTVSVRGPARTHTVSVAKLRSWLSGGGKSPNELATKKKLREVLGV
jgi:hypothetical protein